MLASELTDALDRLGMSKRAFAEFVGVPPSVICGWADGDGQVTRSIKFILCASLMLKQGAGFSNDELRILACRGPREILSALDGEPSSGSPAEA